MRNKRRLFRTDFAAGFILGPLSVFAYRDGSWVITYGA